MTVVKTSSCFDDSRVFPPGFRFHPTDEELVLYYLKKKICRQRILMDVITETDVCKWDPDDLPGISKWKTGDRLWFFFSPRDRKYPNGARSNRATTHGYWKATGKDRIITCHSRSVGVKKTLVFYKGRAPSGERTDWVMHEYTLHEDEVRRCRSAQDYYALYKLYKKSGPGPKNGEQYGAPFQEEDWIDDEVVNGSFNAGYSVNQVNPAPAVDNNGFNSQQQAAVNDLEELVHQSVEHPVPDPDLVNYDYAFQQFVSEEDNQSTLIDQLSREVNIPNQSMLGLPSDQQSDLPSCFDLTNSSISQLQSFEAPEVTSAANTSREKFCVAEEDLFEDFLEMDDLRCPEFTSQKAETPVENFQFDEVDGLSMLDLYHDAAMFLRDIGPGEPGQLSQPYMNNCEDGGVNLISDLYSGNTGNETINYQMQHQSTHADQVSSQLWSHDLRYNTYTPVDAIQGSIPSPASSGVPYNVSSTDLPVEVNQNRGNKEDDASGSWFSSALWSFVESIPTAPASASESALVVNRAIKRMSSFSRMRTNMRTTEAVAGNPTATSRHYCRSRRGFICISLLGIVCAILWTLTR